MNAKQFATDKEKSDAHQLDARGRAVLALRAIIAPDAPLGEFYKWYDVVDAQAGIFLASKLPPERRWEALTDHNRDQ